MQTGLMETLRWMRARRDTIFAAGDARSRLFVFGLKAMVARAGRRPGGRAQAE